MQQIDHLRMDVEALVLVYVAVVVMEIVRMAVKLQIVEQRVLQMGKTIVMGAPVDVMETAAIHVTKDVIMNVQQVVRAQLVGLVKMVLAQEDVQEDVLAIVVRVARMDVVLVVLLDVVVVVVDVLVLVKRLVIQLVAEAVPQLVVTLAAQDVIMDVKTIVIMDVKMDATLPVKMDVQQIVPMDVMELLKEIRIHKKK